MSDSRTTNELIGEVLSPGTTAGTLYLWDFCGKQTIQQERSPSDADSEIVRFENGLNAFIRQLEQSIRSLEEDGYPREADIIRTHLYLLRDKRFQNDIRAEIRTNEVAAEAAVDHILKEMIWTFEQSESSIFFERANDIKDIVIQLKTKLSRQEKHFWDDLHGLDRVILAVQELTPSVLLEARKHKVYGFIVRQGSALSHAVILAKSFGLPVIRISSLRSLEAHHLERVFLNGLTRRIIFQPSGEQLEQAAPRYPAKPVESFKELPVNLWINIIDPRQVTEEIIGKIKGVGLYRTESLFMEQEDDFPTEQQQIETYQVLFEKCGDKPVTFRTADIGGDKMLSYFSLGPQENPYLGFRAHRIFRFHPEILVTQLKAVLKAAANTTQLNLLYPMIETTDELFFIQDLVTQTVDTLKRKNINCKDDFRQGIMIEVPSMAWNCKEILQYVDFASLGTNDLFQYFFAVDRNNANAYRSYQPENPAAIRMLKYILDAAGSLNKPLSICGELASNKRFLPLLIGLGFKNLSIDAHLIDDIGAFISELDISACREMARTCLKMKTSRQVNGMLNNFMPQTADTSEENLTEGMELVDPVCGMVVHIDDSYKLEQDEGIYYFCSIQCKKEFQEATRR